MLGIANVIVPAIFNYIFFFNPCSLHYDRLPLRLAATTAALVATMSQGQVSALSAFAQLSAIGNVEDLAVRCLSMLDQLAQNQNANVQR